VTTEARRVGGRLRGIANTQSQTEARKKNLKRSNFFSLGGSTNSPVQKASRKKGAQQVGMGYAHKSAETNYQNLGNMAA